jgi:hypothetical protein
MRYRAEDGRHWRAHRWRPQRRPMCDMVNHGKRKCVVGDEGKLVDCAADLGNDAEEAAITHQLVRESGSVGVSVRRSLQATLACIRALVVGAPAGGFVHMV